MTPEDVAKRFDVSRESLAKLEIYAALLRRWNARVNLVAAASLPEMWRRHFADSLQLMHHLPKGCTSLVDLGSGAGFPGLALSISTGLDTVLVESNAKKAAFLAEVIRNTEAPARVHHGRIEQLPVDLIADAVTARALAPLSKLVGMAYPLLSKGATGLFLKGQDIEAELTESTKYWKLTYRRSANVVEPAGTVVIVEKVEHV